jgi:hypothetical protein
MFKISKTAKAVAVSIEGKKYSSQAKCVAQLVGQFTGADHGYLPGATFVTMELFKTYGMHGSFRPVKVIGVDISYGRGHVKWYLGATFIVYKVISATPRQVTVEYIKEYEAYGSHYRGCFGFNTSVLDGLFEVMGRGQQTRRTFRVNFEKQDFARLQFKYLKLETAVRYSPWLKQIQCDADGTLVVVEKR